MICGDTLATTAYYTVIAGRAHMFHQVYVCFGVLCSYVLGAVFSYSKLVLACMVLPMLHLIVALFLPESPCYMYMRKSSPTEVKATMRRIKGDEFDTDAGYLALRVNLRVRSLFTAVRVHCEHDGEGKIGGLLSSYRLFLSSPSRRSTWKAWISREVPAVFTRRRTYH
jgi:hypothetical protein